MGLNAAQRKARDRAEREAAWAAEEERVRKLGELFETLPESPERDALLLAMSDRIIDLYNEAKFEQGDAILEFLPNDYAYRLLDWYFDEDAPNVAPDFRRPAWNERQGTAGAPGQSLRAQTETPSHDGTTQAPIEGETPKDQGASGNEVGCAPETCR